MNNTQKSQVDHSNTFDSKESKAAPSSVNIHAYWSFKKPPISKQSFITFRGSKGASDKNIRGIDEISNNPLSFNGNFGFGIKEDIDEHDVLKWFDATLLNYDESIAEDINGELKQNDRDTSKLLYKPYSPEAMLTKYQIQIDLKSKPRAIELGRENQDLENNYNIVKVVR